MDAHPPVPERENVVSLTALPGINTAIFTTSGTFSGVGFALPVTAIAKPVEQLIERGEVVRPSLGIQAARPNIARQLGVQSGGLIQAVQPGSPAATAGLLPTRCGATKPAPPWHGAYASEARVYHSCLPPYLP